MHGFRLVLSDLDRLIFPVGYGDIVAETLTNSFDWAFNGLVLTRHIIKPMCPHHAITTAYSCWSA